MPEEAVQFTWVPRQRRLSWSWVHPGIVRHLTSLWERKITTQLFKALVNLVNTSYLWHICQCGIVIIYLGTVSSRQEVQLVSTASPRFQRVLAGPAATGTAGSPAYQTRALLWAEVCGVRTSACNRKLHLQRWLWKGSVTPDSLYQKRILLEVIACQAECFDFVLKQDAVAISLLFLLAQAPCSHFLALSGNK